MAATRMRFARQAIQELKKEDPDTQVTEHYLRHLIKTGAVPSVSIGNNRRLINYDLLLEYLANPTSKSDEKEVGGIRRLG
jgi:hypothetical protein